MAIKYYEDLEQGSEAWFEARRGLLTASEMKHIITPAKLQYASNDKERAHVYELAAQRLTGYVEPHYIGDEMLRGHEDELRAKIKYNEKYAPLDECGFITNDKWGFTLGYSPDARVRQRGVVECKSRRQKFQLETIVNNAVPDEFKIQLQTGLLVSEEPWSDYVTYCGGMPMFIIRVEPDETVQKAIIAAATTFEEKVKKVMALYAERMADTTLRFTPTERVIFQEMYA